MERTAAASVGFLCRAALGAAHVAPVHLSASEKRLKFITPGLNRMAPVSRRVKAFTPKQGQYLAYIYAYTRLHRRPPAESEMREYFRVAPNSVHQMVLTLERGGFIKRQPRTARSIELLVDPKRLTDLL